MLSPLSHLEPGASARIVLLLATKAQPKETSIQERLLDLGFEPGVMVSCLIQQKNREISAFLVKGSVIALRKEDADLILTEEAAR